MRQFVYTRKEKWERNPGCTSHTMHLYKLTRDGAKLVGSSTVQYLTGEQQALALMKRHKALPKKYFERTCPAPWSDAAGVFANWSAFSLRANKVANIQEIT